MAYTTVSIDFIYIYIIYIYIARQAIVIIPLSVVIYLCCILLVKMQCVNFVCNMEIKKLLFIGLYKCFLIWVLNDFSLYNVIIIN